MTAFLESISLFPVVLTLGTFVFGGWLQKKTKLSFLSPLLVAMVLVIAFILISGFGTDIYQAGTEKFGWLLTPATVCLALPLYEQLKVLKKHLGAIILGVCAGTLVSLAFILVTCRLFALDSRMTYSLLPKSITTAIALALTQESGLVGLTTAAIIITGNLGNLVGSFLCKVFRITDPIAQGVGFGTASHVIGTARANQVSPLTGAVSSLSLAIAGLLTAVLFPFACMLI